MPGLSLVQKESAGPRGDLSDLLDDQLYLDNYYKSILYSDRPVQIGYSGYETYPVRVFEDEEYFVALEGYLYGTSDVESSVRRIVRNAFAGNDREVTSWVKTRDAEFLLIAIERESNRIVVLNDVLGRLPTYLYDGADATVLSRELSLVTDSEEVRMDPMGVAQLLLFGYPLGDRTLYDDVTVVEPGSLVTISGDDLSVDSVHRYRVDRQFAEERPIEENAARSAELLSEACNRRGDLGENVISLSGGLDSRAIAACFDDNEIPFVTATYSMEHWDESDEVRVAREVADVLGKDWKKFDISHPTGDELLDMLRMKRGMNYLGMGYILNFFEELRSDHGSDIVYITGDGGDKIFPPLRERGFKSTEAVVEYLVKDASRFSLERVAELSPCTSYEIRDEIHDVLEGYPERDPNQKYKKFLFKERGSKWLFHGEDRNRYYFWSVAPFWAWPLVEYTMKVPDAQKKMNALYNEMLSVISGDMRHVEYVNFGAPIDSIEYKVKRKAYDVLSHYPRVRKAIVSVLKGRSSYEYDRTIANVISDQIDDNPDVDGVLSARDLEDICEDRNSCNRTQIYNLLTAISSYELLNGRSAFGEYVDHKFN